MYIKITQYDELCPISYVVLHVVDHVIQKCQKWMVIWPIEMEVFHVTNLLPMNISLHYRLFISLCVYGYRLEPGTHTLSALTHLCQ